MFESIVLENFLSFRDKTEFTFIASQERSKSGYEYVQWVREINKVKILKAQFLFGNNGTGKSNFLYVFRVLKDLICTTRRSKLADEDQLDNCQFKFSSETKTKPSYICAVFHTNGIRYTYEIQWGQNIIYYESLAKQVNSRRNIPIFHRVFDQDRGVVKISWTSKEISSTTRTIIDENVIPCTTVLSLYDEKNIESNDFKNVFSYFAHILSVPALDSIDLPSMFENRNNKEELHDVLISLLNALGSNIIDYKVRTIDAKLNDRELAVFKLVLPEEIFKKHYSSGLKKTYVIEFAHNADTETKIEWLTENEESSGTLNMIRLIIAFFDAIKHHSPIVIDECAADIHQQTFGRIMQFFLSVSEDCQAFMASQHTALMDMDGFRRDTLKFFDKDRMTGVTSCKKVDLRKYHKNLNITKAYLDNSFGSLPQFPTQEEWEKLLCDYKTLMNIVIQRVM